MGILRQWHVDPGNEIVIPQGSEIMRQSLGHEIWYSPQLDHSYFIQGSNLSGWDVTEYDQALCGRCWERRDEYRERGR